MNAPLRAVSTLALVTAAACTVAPELPDGAIVFGHVGAPTRPESVLVYEGRPSRPYETIGWVRACSVLSSTERLLREQAAGAGADAIVEWTVSADPAGPCAAGVAVRLRP